MFTVDAVAAPCNAHRRMKTRCRRFLPTSSRRRLSAVPAVGDVVCDRQELVANRAELELILQPSTGLPIAATATYLDATIKDFTGINAAGVEADFKGTSIPLTPKWQLGSNVSYTTSVSDSLEAFVSGSVNYRSKTAATIGGNVNPAGVTPSDFDVFGIKAYATVDAQIGVKSSDGRWRASLWGKNITNTYYWNNVAAAVDVIERYTGMPATYGVSFGITY
jgi:hypothetical protein